MALFSALTLLALTAILVAGSLASANMVGRSGRLAQADAVLSMAADYAVHTVLADAQSLSLAGVSPGQTVAVPVTVPGQLGVRATVYVTRLASGTLWLVADASLASGEAGHRRVNVVARIAAPTVFDGGAIVARGDVGIGSGVVFESDSTRDPGCASVPDIVLAPGARLRATVDTAGSALGVATRAAAGDSASYWIDGHTWAELAGRSGVTNAPGDLTLIGGSGRGVLLVGGRLTITGPFAFSGIIVARGGVQTTGTGTRLDGVIMSYSGDSLGVRLAGVTLRKSRCAALHALEAIVPIRPVRERSWAEVY